MVATVFDTTFWVTYCVTGAVVIALAIVCMKLLRKHGLVPEKKPRTKAPAWAWWLFAGLLAINVGIPVLAGLFTRNVWVAGFTFIGISIAMSFVNIGLRAFWKGASGNRRAHPPAQRGMQ